MFLIPTYIQNQILLDYSSWHRYPRLGSPVWDLDPLFLRCSVRVIL